MNRFKIHDSFAIEPDLFVFAGEILEGNVAKGMSFDVPEAGHRWHVVVSDIGFIRKSGGGELIGLTVKNASPSYLPGLGAGWTAELRE
jgi:uncharacterized protein YfaS (alpha-2-macroglobulin family)